MTLKTRKPTGAVPWPLVLLEGEEKAGKSWALAELSASDKVGDTYWFDLGEGAADEYGAIPGARYPLGGPCTVCGYQARGLVVFLTRREVWHVPGAGQPCVLPNPPARKAVA